MKNAAPPTFEGTVYSFHKKASYPAELYLAKNLEESVHDLLIRQGWSKTPLAQPEESNKLAIKLTIKEASPPLQSLITRPPPMAVKAIGKESFSTQNGIPIYRYEKFGLMTYKENYFPWEMAILKPTVLEDLKKLEIMLSRFLSLSLWGQQLIGFWGHPWEDGVLLTRPQEGNYNCFFIDRTNFHLIYQSELIKIPSSLTFYVTDKTILPPTRMPMPKEELLSYLFSRTLSLPIGTENGPRKLRQLFQEILSFGTGKKIAPPKATQEILRLSY